MVSGVNTFISASLPLLLPWPTFPLESKDTDDDVDDDDDNNWCPLVMMVIMMITWHSCVYINVSNNALLSQFQLKGQFINDNYTMCSNYDTLDSDLHPTYK